MKEPGEVCSCGKAFIDDVFVRLYHCLIDAGLLSGNEPLSAVGTPLIDPGLYLRAPPHLPLRSLLIISSVFDADTAQRAYRTIPHISGILSDCQKPPGIGDTWGDSEPVWSEHTLLCGCDVRADLFSTSRGPVAIYKKQGSAHIEFPHGLDPKIRSLESAIRTVHPDLMVDACSGSGTLGISSMRLGVDHVILNDPWYAAAFFSGFNLMVNHDILGLNECTICYDFSDFSCKPVRKTSLLVAEGFGDNKHIEVFQGMMESLPPRVSSGRILTAYDPFDKGVSDQNQSLLSFWHKEVGGEVFIP